MSLRHVHTWVEHARTYAAPMGYTGTGPADAVLLAVSGSTSFLFRCTDPTCGAMRTERLLGAIASPAPEAPHAL